MSDALEYTKNWTDEKFLAEAKRVSEEWEETLACYSYDAMLVEVGERRGIYVPFLFQQALRIKEAGDCQNPHPNPYGPCCCRRHLGSSPEAKAIMDEIQSIIEQVYRDGMARGYRVAKGLPIVGDDFKQVVKTP